MSLEEYRRRTGTTETNAEMLKGIRKKFILKELVTECPSCQTHSEFKYLGMKPLGNEQISIGTIPMYKCRTCGEEESGYSLIVHRVRLEEKAR